MWKKKNVPDERIVKESNKLSAKMYYVITFLTIVSLIIKMICKLPVYVYGLEIISLVASTIFVVVSELRKGILFIKEKDDALLTIHREILSKGEMIAFWIFIIGEFIFLFVGGEYFFWVLSYFAIWLIPALVITIASIKNGWLIWGSRKREVEGKKNFKVRVAIGSLAYGLIVGFPFLFKKGVFQPSGILWILGLAAAWGILFYVAFTAIMKIAEKRADKNLEEKEKAIEE